MTKVAVAVPCLDMVAADFAFSLAALMSRRAYDPKLRKAADVALIHQSGSIIMDARNALVARAQEMNASHVLFLDSDMTFPPDTLDRLLAHHKPVVAATYVKRTGDHGMLGEPLMNEHFGLRPYRTIPLGCALINMNVFEKLPRPYFRYVTTERGTISEDTWFCLQCEEAKVPIYVDPKLTAEVGHVGVKVYRP